MVEVTDSNGFTTRLSYSNRDYYINNSVLPKPGVLYSIMVKVPGFEVATAQNKIPNDRVNIQRIKSKAALETEPVTGTGEEASINVQLLEVDFIQNMQSNDYMGVSVIIHPITHNYINDSVFITEDRKLYVQGFLRTKDPSIKDEGLEGYFESGILLFKDKLFNHEKASITFSVEKKTSSKFWLHFFQFSHEAFLYTKSWIIHDYTKEYDFWELYEPLPLYSNIENGYGIFAGYSEQLYEIYPDSTVNSQ